MTIDGTCDCVFAEDDNKTMRTKRIAVSDAEKELLDNAAVELTGTTDVPYGSVITMLIREATDIEEVN